MRRLALAVSLILLLGAPALIAAPVQSDVLLTTDGMLYVIEIVDGNELPEGTRANTGLRLRTLVGEAESTAFVPASLIDGFSSSPALAYDEASETLFIFWVRAPQITTSELVFSSFHDGEFSEATAVDRGLLRMRSNLKIAVTQYAKKYTTETVVPALAVHAVWWDSTGWGETARYALLSISSGVARVIEVRDLIEFLGEDRSLEPAFLPEGFNPAVLRFPTIDAADTQDRVEVVFADPDTNRFERIDLYPVLADGVLRPPIGISRGELPLPVFEAVESDSISTLIGSSLSSDMILFAPGADRLDYVHFNDGQWSETRTIRLDDRVTEATAVDALRRMLATY